jgi:hypothetical protein
MRNCSQHSGEFPTKNAVTVTEMATMVGLSRSRFHQLLGTVFPLPIYDLRTRRPFFTEAQQRMILDLRASNCGVDGKPVLFYASRSKRAASKAKLRQKPDNTKSSHSLAQVVKGVKSLGIKSVSPAEVKEILGQLFPAGTGGVAILEQVKSVFLELGDRARKTI